MDDLRRLPRSAKAAVCSGPHKLTVGRQVVNGNQPYDYLGVGTMPGDAVGFFANKSQDADFNLPHEYSWQLRYDLDIVVFGGSRPDLDGALPHQRRHRRHRLWNGRLFTPQGHQRWQSLGAGSGSQICGAKLAGKGSFDSDSPSHPAIGCRGAACGPAQSG